MPEMIRMAGWYARAATAVMMCSSMMAQTAEVRATEPQPAHAGNEWTLHFAEGGKVKYRLMPLEGEPGVSLFADKSGHEVKIMVADDSRVLIVPSEGGCYRTGTLVDRRVTNGTSGGDCKPGGSWTAEIH